MNVADILTLYAKPLPDLLYLAQQVHRSHFDANEIQLSTLLSIKTGGCPEDCAYCPQSRRYSTGVNDEPLLSEEVVVAAARAAKERGATRFCMGAAWRSPKDRDLAKVLPLIEQVKALGMETCATLGMLREDQAHRLREVGLDYYNHNLDTSPRHYKEIISTREYSDRMETLRHVRAAGINVCCGGIIGMGETREDRAELIAQLSGLEPYPESVPINRLVRIPGTPLESTPPLEDLEFVRTIAVTRIAMPKARVRLSAGRESMSEPLQALCILAGANSIFYGEKLLTAPNAATDRDNAFLTSLGLKAAVA